MAEPAPQRRRRRRATSAQGSPAPSVEAREPASHDQPSDPTPTRRTQPPQGAQSRQAAQPRQDDQPRHTGASAPRRGRRPREDRAERGLRELAGAGHSQVGVSGALRARDVNRPTDEDLAKAEAETVIVRRNWQPDQEPGKRS